MAITSSGNYEIKGVTESSAKDNYVIEAKFNNAVIASEAFSVAKVKILRTIGTGQPTEITDTTTVIVGERIKLSAEIAPSGISVSGHNWVIPEKAVKDFNVAASANRKPAFGQERSVDGLNTDEVSFLWVNGSFSGTNKEVNYNATISGSQIPGTAIFNVKAPATSMTSVSGETRISLNHSGTVYSWLVLARLSAPFPGITFTRGATTMPDSFSGSFQFVQLINVNVSGQTTTGAPIANTLFGLDECYPYVLSNTTAPDSPGAALQNAFMTAMTMTYTGNWEMYLMFKPNTPDSDWVPVLKTSWAWSGIGNLTGTNPNQWTPINVTLPNGPNGVATTDYPNWGQISSQNVCIG